MLDEQPNQIEVPCREQGEPEGMTGVTCVRLVALVVGVWCVVALESSGPNSANAGDTETLSTRAAYGIRLLHSHSPVPRCGPWPKGYSMWNLKGKAPGHGACTVFWGQGVQLSGPRPRHVVHTIDDGSGFRTAGYGGSRESVFGPQERTRVWGREAGQPRCSVRDPHTSGRRRIECGTYFSLQQ